MIAYTRLHVRKIHQRYVDVWRLPLKCSSAQNDACGQFQPCTSAQTNPTQDLTKTLYAHPGVRVLKYAPSIHSIPLWLNQPINGNLHKPQHPSTGHPIAFPLGLGLGFGSGGRRQAPRPKKKTMCTTYLVRGILVQLVVLILVV